MTVDLILGTAGHIDHGKTALIRALTGRDTDRLPEERRRGITIDLGFAELRLGDYRLGVVDVPGHERFVRNMLAGATGMDLAMLVVAADDSVKPQTREHLEILRLLNLDAGVLVITKCDLAEPEWVDLVAAEVRELVAETFLASAPLVRTSATTGAGLDELRRQLEQAAAKAAGEARMARIRAPFRMAIDRAFTIAGHGTVVTGSVSSGRTQLGDELVIEPLGLRVRVRGLQNHESRVESVHRGQRAAINLAGAHHEQIGRGQEVCTPGHLQPSRLLTVELRMLPSAPRALKDRSRLRVHVGTAELLATVRLLDGDQLAPGGQAFGQLFLQKPAVTVWSQPLVLRSVSPVVTIGGGRVLDPSAERIRRPDEQQRSMLQRLASQDPVARASAALYFAGLRDFLPQDLPRSAGVDDYENVYQNLRQAESIREIRLSPSRSLRIHESLFQRLCDRVTGALQKMHDANPLRSVLDAQPLRQRFRYLPDTAVLDCLLKELQAQGRVQRSPRGLTLVGSGPKLTQSEQKLLQKIVGDYREAGFEAPTVKQYQRQVTRNQDAVPQLLALAAANGDLVEISSDFYLHSDVEKQCRERVAAQLKQSPGLTMSEIRETLNTSRKYAVPFCEYLDRIGVTQRRGDLRVLAGKEGEPG